ncbi:hypothetical protein D3C71_471700 [compost metagenome]
MASLYPAPREVLLNVVAEENNIVLYPEDYDFLNPTPATPPQGSSAQYNTKVTIEANNIAAAYQESVDIFYNRLKLEDLATLVSLSLKAPADVDTSHKLIPSLNSRFGLNLLEEDLELTLAVSQGDFKTIDLVAAAGSIGWIGTATATVAEGEIDLETYLTVTALPGLKYPTEYPTRPFAQFYSYWRDFTTYHPQIYDLQAGDPITATISDMLTTVTGDTWLTSGPGTFSLGGAVITYAGLTAGQGIFNTDYKYGIVIRLDHTTASGIAGDLIIHFNDPVDAGGDTV